LSAYSLRMLRHHQRRRCRHHHHHYRPSPSGPVLPRHRRYSSLARSLSVCTCSAERYEQTHSRCTTC
jgi:hypothetical protein